MWAAHMGIFLNGACAAETNKTRFIPREALMSGRNRLICCFPHPALMENIPSLVREGGAERGREEER